MFASPGLKLAEWPEKAAGLLPTADLRIAIAFGQDDRRVATLSAHTPLGVALLP